LAVILKSNLCPLLVAIAVSICLPCAAAEPARQKQAQAERNALTPEEAKRALDLIQNDQKRAELIATLQAIAKAAPSPAETTGQVPPENLGAQLLMQVSGWIRGASDQIGSAAEAVTNFPLLWSWIAETASDPTARNTILDMTWKIVLVIGCALAAERLADYGMRRPRAFLARHAPARSPESSADAAETRIDDLIRGGEDKRRSHAALARARKLALRFPFAVARLLLDLVPLSAFVVVADVMLATKIGADYAPRLVVLALINAYVLLRGIMCLARALVSAESSPLSLFAVRGDTAAYIQVWTRRIATVTVFGTAFANVALALGLSQPAYEAILNLVVLVAHLFLIIVILQCRRSVARLIAAPADRAVALAALRNRLADTWHYFAIVIDIAVWAISALRIHNGYALVAQYLVATLAIAIVARLAGLAILSALDRVFRINPEFLRRFPGLEVQANRYYPLLRSTVSGAIVVVAVIAVLEVWGVHAIDWFQSGQVGGRLVSAAVTITIAIVVALAIWESTNSAIERHLNKLALESRYARAARLRTLLPMFKTAFLLCIVTVIGLTALSELGVNIAPLLAGAGIVGLAIGFGSQKLVQDVITGLFLLLENAMQVGDIVTVSGLMGTVENLTIRTIRLRAADGSVHIIPFSSVTSVTNTNRGIGNAAVNVSVAYKENIDRVYQVLHEVAVDLRKDPRFQHMIRGDLDLWGIDKIDGAMVTVVGQIQCTAAGRWPVQREFNHRMKKRFEELGIQIAHPGQTILIPGEGGVVAGATAQSSGS
jgi:moderate conductance mechanosensitive channel